MLKIYGESKPSSVGHDSLVTEAAENQHLGSCKFEPRSCLCIFNYNVQYQIICLIYLVL